MIYIEDQAFSLSYDLTHLPTLPTLSSQQVVSLSQSSVSPVELADERVGEEPNHKTERKNGPL